MEFKFNIEEPFPMEVTLPCPKCEGTHFTILREPTFVCDNCGQYYQDLDQLKLECEDIKNKMFEEIAEIVKEAASKHFKNK